MGGRGRQHSPLAGPGPAARARCRQTWVSRLLGGVRGLPQRPAGRGRRGCGRRRAALGRTLTPPAGSRVPAPTSSLLRAPTAPRAAPQARAGPARAPRRLGERSGRVLPCPCPRLPSGDACPAPRHGGLLYPSRSRWPCRAPVRGLSPCARQPRCTRDPSGRGPAGVARPRNSMQLRPPPQLLPGGLPRAWRPPSAPARLCLRLCQEPGFTARLGRQRPASPRAGKPPPPLCRLANSSLGFQAAQPEERLGARAPILARAHTGTHEGRAEAWQTVLLPFLPKEAAHVNSGKLLFLGIG